jgi:adenylate cyclase class 2
VSARRNIELKARDTSPQRSLECCRALGAEDHGELWQRDTYFTVAHGGLKLREQRPGTAHLIQYERPDRAEQRESRYRLVEVDDGAVALAALGTALGVVGVVVKRRRLFLWRGVRIHLDDVESLGTFIEFEAVASPASDLEREHALLDELRSVFAIAPQQLVGSGYLNQLTASLN